MFRLKKINWKKGSSELIGFAIVLPFLMILIMGIIGISQLGITRMALEQSAYIGCRAAVVRDNKDAGANAAINAVKMRMGQGTFGVKQEDITVVLEPVAGVTDTSTGDTPKWIKGSMVRCDVEVKVNMFLGFLPNTMKSTIYMMIEQPAEVFG